MLPQETWLLLSERVPQYVVINGQWKKLDICYILK